MNLLLKVMENQQCNISLSNVLDRNFQRQKTKPDATVT